MPSKIKKNHGHKVYFHISQYGMKYRGTPHLLFFIKISQNLCLKDPQYLMQK